MGRLYFVLCCLIFIFHANSHELSINFGAHQFMINYMVIICLLCLVLSMRIRFVLTFFHPFCECLGTFSIFFFSYFLFLFSKRSVFLLYSLFLIISDIPPHPQPLPLQMGGETCAPKIYGQFMVIRVKKSNNIGQQETIEQSNSCSMLSFVVFVV